jgi:uncharacterized protein
MMVSEEYVFVPVKGGKKISGIVSVPDRFIRERKPGVILAHGSNNDMFHPLIAHMANVLAEAGYLSMRFNFLYRDEERKTPDSDGALEASWVQVYEFLKNHPLYKPSSIVAGGKSLGGRIASRIVSDNLIQAGGLIFLGYPLHPPGRSDEPRDSHLYRIRVPMLFFAGSNDPYCSIEKLSEVLAKMDALSTLEVIEGGDHSFKLPEPSEVSEKEIYARILGKTLSWLRSI